MTDKNDMEQGNTDRFKNPAFEIPDRINSKSFLESAIKESANRHLALKELSINQHLLHKYGIARLNYNRLTMTKNNTGEYFYYEGKFVIGFSFSEPEMITDKGKYSIRHVVSEIDIDPLTKKP
jgi:hypothetical protein